MSATVFYISPMELFEHPNVPKAIQNRRKFIRISIPKFNF